MTISTTFFRRLALPTILSATTLLAPFSVFGQGAANQEEDIQELETYIVEGYTSDYQVLRGSSATRLPAKLRDIPINLSVYTEDLLIDQNILEAVEVSKNIPNAYAVGNEIAMRGFAHLYFRDGSLIGLIESNFPVPGGSPPINMFEIEAVEVLKGPASILFGRGDPGGTVNFITKKPYFETGGEVRALIDSEGTLRGDIDVNFAVNEDVAFRAIATQEESESFIDSTTQDSTYVLLSGRVVGERYELNGYYGYADVEATSPQGLLMVPDPINFSSWEEWVGLTMAGQEPRINWVQAPEQEIRDYNGVPGDLSTAESHRGRIEASVSVTENFTIRGEIIHEEMTGTLDSRFMVEYLYDNFSEFFTNIFLPFTGFPIDYDLYGFDVSGNYHVGRSTRDLDRTNTNYRLDMVFDFSHSLGDSTVEHQLLASFDHYELDFNWPNLINEPSFFNPVSKANQPVPVPPVSDFVFVEALAAGDISATAFILQDFISINDKLFLLAGFRYEDYERLDTRNGTISGFQDQFFSSDDDAIVPRFGINYAFSPETNVYVNYMESFSPPGLNQRARTGELDSVTGYSLELGVKHSMMENRFLVSASVFVSEKDDIIQEEPNFDQFNPFFENAGNEDNEGAEIEIRGFLTENFRVLAAAGYHDPRIVDAADPFLEGKLQVAQPRFTGSFWGVYSFDGSVDGLEAGIGLYYRSKVGLNRREETYLGSATNVEARLSYNIGNFDVALHVDNVFDSDELEPFGVTIGGNPFSPTLVTAQRPRLFTLSGSYRF